MIDHSNPIDPEEPYQPTEPDEPDVAPPLTDDQKQKLNEKPAYQASQMAEPPGVQKITQAQEEMQVNKH